MAFGAPRRLTGTRADGSVCPGARGLGVGWFNVMPQTTVATEAAVPIVAAALTRAPIGLAHIAVTNRCRENKDAGSGTRQTPI